MKRIRTKSRFLRAPVEPFVVLPDAAAGDLLARMERISFQGRNLAVARRIWEKMLGDKKPPPPVLEPRFKSFETSGLKAMVEAKRNELPIKVEKIKRR